MRLRRGRKALTPTRRMPRVLTLTVLALGLLLPAAADAQTRERVKVTSVRLGLPAVPSFSSNGGTGTV